MSDSDDGNPAPGGRESPVGMAGAWVGADGDQDALILNSVPQGGGGDAAASMVAAEVAEPMESLREEAGAVGNPEGGANNEDSDIGPAEEEENMGPGPEMAVDAHQFPMEGFRLMFLNLLHTLLHRMHYNNHILMHPRGIRRMSRSRHQRSGRVAQIRVLLMSGGSREQVIAMVPYGSRERVIAMVHESADGPARFGPGVPALPEPEGQARDMAEESAAGEMAEEEQEEPIQEVEAPRGEDLAEQIGETTEEGAVGAESKEDSEALNQKQEGPEMVVDPAESRSSKSRYLCVALNITQPFLAFTCY
ncbi:cancer/testis antigen 47A-like [Myotis daubentonii]|uniref:cancer/testis antigen 47A-like n=1 Tax=Myotis daubentonii TaxID=98922 RepID=UPI0028739518|nr:cancer/testis antigen 47A-like [Myotis daubentonii]